mmetsp:Transcript_31585/g.80562  ORF Transcript_31585/g.80562 Transcript_31585/m.80562 type:complete len:422 (+) Transcript_31585:831-2096(+)
MRGFQLARRTPVTLRLLVPIALEPAALPLVLAGVDHALQLGGHPPQLLGGEPLPLRGQVERRGKALDAALQPRAELLVEGLEVMEVLLDNLQDLVLVSHIRGHRAGHVEILSTPLEDLEVCMLVWPDKRGLPRLPSSVHLKDAPQAAQNVERLVGNDDELLSRSYRRGKRTPLGTHNALAISILVKREAGHVHHLLSVQRYLQRVDEVIEVFRPQVRDEGADFQRTLWVHHRRKTLARAASHWFYVASDHGIHVWVHFHEPRRLIRVEVGILHNGDLFVLVVLGQVDWTERARLVDAHMLVLVPARGDTNLVRAAIVGQVVADVVTEVKQLLHPHPHVLWAPAAAAVQRRAGLVQSPRRFHPSPVRLWRLVGLWALRVDAKQDRSAQHMPFVRVNERLTERDHAQQHAVLVPVAREAWGQL